MIPSTATVPVNPYGRPSASTETSRLLLVRFTFFTTWAVARIASQTYSAAIRSDPIGRVGSRRDGSPEPDFEAQVRLAFANLKTPLQAGGCGFDDIVNVTTFHTDPENQFGMIMAVKSEVFPEAPYPNWTAIGVNWLAGLRFEVKVIARIPD